MFLSPWSGELASHKTCWVSRDGASVCAGRHRLDRVVDVLAKMHCIREKNWYQFFGVHNWYQKT